MKLSNLSKYRSQLMGVAAVFITLCHTQIVFPLQIAETIYNIYIQQLLQSGVDIFLLLSGLGCYYSFRKTPSVGKFYAKRLIRILPSYVMCVVADGILRAGFLGGDITTFYLNNYIVGFYFYGRLGVWFVGAILLLYLSFPLLYLAVNRSYRIVLIAVAVFMGCLLLPIWGKFPHSIVIIRELFLIRIPVFVVGACSGKLLFQKKEVVFSKRLCILVFVASIALFTINALWNTSDKWIISRALFLPFSFVIALSFSNIFDKRKSINRNENKALLFLGSISYELYLVFERILSLINNYLPRPSFIFSHVPLAITSLLINITSILIAIVLSFLLHKVSDRMTRRIKQSF